MRKNFSYMYKKLVADEDDIIGHIAYSVYKSQKMNIIQKKKDAKGEEYVSDEELAPFLEISQSEDQIAFYRERAITLSQRFLNEAMAEELEAEKQRIEKEFVRNHKTHGFMYGVWQGIVASFLFVLAGFLLLIATGGWAKIGKALSEIAK